MVLVGRDRELSVLDDLVVAARSGSGGTVLLHGEPGIGKTALLDELVGRSELRTVRACGYESEVELPFATLADLIRPVLDRLVDIPAAQADAITSALGLQRAASLDSASIDVAVVNLLRVVAQNEPLLVVVDDLPWVDTGSQSAILRLARRAVTLPVAVVLAARREDLTASMAQSPCLAVEPLSVDDAAAIIRADAPDAARGNFDFTGWEPVPAGSRPAGASAWGVHDLVGNGWEWTATAFGPFPGFEPMVSYPEYSADFFDGQHYVMKGASPATARELVRRSFRNWFRPNYPYVYATFRTVSRLDR